MRSNNIFHVFIGRPSRGFHCLVARSLICTTCTKRSSCPGGQKWWLQAESCGSTTSFYRHLHHTVYITHPHIHVTRAHTQIHNQTYPHMQHTHTHTFCMQDTWIRAHTHTYKHACNTHEPPTHNTCVCTHATHTHIHFHCRYVVNSGRWNKSGAWHCGWPLQLLLGCSRAVNQRPLLQLSHGCITYLPTTLIDYWQLCRC